MKKNFRFPLISGGILGMIFIVVVAMTIISCGKPPHVDPNPPPPVDTTTKSAGIIDHLTLKDTLVAFNSETSPDWLVTGTNWKTVVTLNDVVVSASGTKTFSGLKADLTFVLKVNTLTAQSKSVTVKVADSLKTSLWSNGKTFHQTKFETDDNGNGQWVLQPNAMMQTFTFYLNGTLRLIRPGVDRIVPYKTDLVVLTFTIANDDFSETLSWIDATTAVFNYTTIEGLKCRETFNVS